MSESSNPQPALWAAIRKLRAKSCVTPQATAEDAGITVAPLSKIERGLTHPTWGTVSSIATALGATMIEIAQAVEGARK